MDELILNSLIKYKEIIQKNIDKNPVRKKEKEDLLKLIEEKVKELQEKT